MRNNNNTKFLHWLMWVSAASFYCYEFFLQVSPAVMIHQLMRTFSINAAQVGLLAAIYYYSYAAMQIPAGVMLDRFGARRLLTCAAATCAIGALLFCISNLFILAFLGRFLLGLGSAFAFISCMFIAASWLPLNRFSLLTGLTLAIGMLGAVNGQITLAVVVTKIGWRLTMLFLSFIGLLIAILIWLLVRDRHAVDIEHKKMITEQKLLQGLKQVIANPQSWLCAIYAGLMFTPTIIFGAIWGTSFISAKYQISTSSAATLVSMLFIGWIVGAPILGVISDYFKNRKIVMLASVLGALVSLILVIYVMFSYVFAGLFLFVFGFFSSGLIIGFSVIREINLPTATGAAVGFMNCINMLGAAFIPPVVGYILDISGTEYELALTILPIFLFIAFIVLLGIKETHAQIPN